MATTLSSLETTVRDIIGDFSNSGRDLFTYANSSIFTIGEPNVISVSSVSVNETSSGVSYTYNSTTNKVTISSSLSSGDSIEIDYTYYPDFSSTEVQAYIKSAITHLSINNYFTWEVESSTLYPDPTPREINLIAMIASLIAKPDNKTYRLPDLSIVAPKDVPLHEKIRRTIAVFKKNKHGIFEIT